MAYRQCTRFGVQGRGEREGPLPLSLRVYVCMYARTCMCVCVCVYRAVQAEMLLHLHVILLPIAAHPFKS